MKKKLLSVLLVGTMLSTMLAGCGGQTADTASNNTTAPATTDNAVADNSSNSSEGTSETSEWPRVFEQSKYDAESAEIYDDAFGEFYEYYQKALEASSVSERYALMAVAEAKMLESGVMLPLLTRGGNYAISKIAPNTITSVLWGNDAFRYYSALVTDELITAEDRDEMKAHWSELRGTGTYEEWAKSFLEEKGYVLKDTLNYEGRYTSDPTTWDVLATSQAVDSEAIINTYDGLLIYNIENELVPALAESYDISADGLTYTFHLREGVKWVDSQGREVGEVTADDWVAGMQHMMDAMGGLEYLVEGIIVNASEYIYGDISDFSQVGVKAVDDYTLEYTLMEPTSYFLTMLGYGVFAPMNRSYYESQGGKFGAEFDSSAADYTYGKDPNSIAYCGPYLVTNATALNTIVFQANESYWNTDAVNVKTITWVYNGGDDPLKNYNDAMSGVSDVCGMNTQAAEQAKTDGIFDEYAYISETDATSYMAFWNLNRYAFANFNDSTKAVSSATQEIADRTKAAINNRHFRVALNYSIDRGAYNAQSVGEDLKLNRLRNVYTPGTFVTLEEDVTIDINGTATKFSAGTNYGEIMQAQATADGFKALLYDPKADGGIGSSDGYDGWYNPSNAKEELQLAIDELAEAGVEISADNPIYIDYPYQANSEIATNRANVLKQSVENSLGGSVIINLIVCNTADEWYYTSYYPSAGYEGNFDLADSSGWGPDYGDPKTYLDTLLPDYAGYMTKTMGLY